MGQTMECPGRNGTWLRCRWISLALLALAVFVSLPSTLRGQTETLLYQFQGGTGATADGTYPNAGLVADSSGNLYGTASGGGNFTTSGGCAATTPMPVGCGIIFKLTPPSYAETVLYRFQGCPGNLTCGPTADGASPMGALIIDTYGNLFGTTTNGGNTGCSSALLGCGTVFVLCENPASSGPVGVVCNGKPLNTEVVLARMGVVLGTNGRHPVSSLVMDSFGNLYGTNNSGNNSCGTSGCGGVFVVCAPGAAVGDPAPCVGGAASYVYNEIYGFSGVPDGSYPRGGLAISPSGVLFGTTTSGGFNNATNEPCGKTEDSPIIFGCGTVFELVPSGGPTWTETLLYNFQGYPNDGSYPSSTLIFDSAGNLYGTTEVGPLGGGTVFELNGASAAKTTLFQFTNRWDGGNIYAGITFINSSDSKLAGTTYSGGGGNLGAVYELKESSPSIWNEVGGTLFGSSAEQAVYNFEQGHVFEGQCPVGTDGCNPYGGVLSLAATVNGVHGSYLFGTTYYGGKKGFGTVYAILP
jgi:uncharacterized repeat protein (TIGR03803 family)